MSDPRLSEAAQLLRERSGVTVPAYRQPLLAAELERLGQGDLERGLAVFRADDQALTESIASMFAVGETYLFRGPDHFHELRRLAALGVARGMPFEVLCAGVSTGEEAWSAAMVLAELYEPTGLPYQVLGWDLSRERLHRARRGCFRQWSARCGFLGYDRYVKQTEGGHEIDATLRRHVRFEHVNLAGRLPQLNRLFDVIFFRNVSMYWCAKRASEVAAALSGRLARGGRLFVGASDPISLPSQDWSPQLIGNALVYRRVVSPRPSVPSLEAANREPAARTSAARAALPVTRSRRRLPPLASAPAPASSPSTDELGERIRMLADRGSQEQALELLRSDGSSSPELRALEGIVHLSRGDHDAAIECFRAAIYWDPNTPAYARWLELAINTRERAAPI